VSTTRTRLAVPEISCEHCKSSIEGAIAPLAGVARVDVDVERRLVTVDHDAAVASAPRLVDAVERQGYEVAGQDEGPLG